MKKKNALIIVPHQDDMDIFCFHAVYDLIKKDYQIFEVVMTDGRFGTDNPEFSRESLRRIRKTEVENAAKTYGIDKNGIQNVQLIMMNYSDGYLPFDKRSISRLQEVIEKYNPEIIYGAEPFFALDWHHDHIATGRNYYYALKSLPVEKRPKEMYFFQSFRNDTYLPVGSFDLQEKVLECYKSQNVVPRSNLYKNIIKMFYFFRSLRKGLKPSAGYRKVQFDNEKNQFNNITDSLLYRLIFPL
ncbi:MAG: hypothetical protein GY870_00570, partial [archaeon]|nr:hypothetical protein [archaeon]